MKININKLKENQALCRTLNCIQLFAISILIIALFILSVIHLKSNSQLLVNEKQMIHLRDNIEELSEKIRELEIEKAENENTIKKLNEILDKYYQEQIDISSIQDKINNLNLLQEDPNKFDITKLTNLSIDEIESGLKGTNFEGLGEYYYKAEQEIGVNALILIGISANETGWGSSAAFHRNNTHGLTVGGEVISMPSKETCILKTSTNLLNNYYKKGLKNLDYIQPKYCPPNDQWNHDTSYIIANNLVPKIKEYLEEEINRIKSESVLLEYNSI